MRTRPRAWVSHAPPSSLRWRLAARLPSLFPGTVLHHAALWAAGSGARELARRLFTVAAERYRNELCVECLARLRVHELMFGCADTERGADRALEVERRLLALRTIESPRSPFAMVEAKSLVGTWPGLLPPDPSTGADAEHEDPNELRLAA